MMFCTECGERINPGQQNCPNCGARTNNSQKAGSVRPNEGGAVKGFFLLVGSFFAMPFKTLQITLKELRDVGGAGKLGSEATTLPHLTWLQVAGHLIASIVVVILILSGLFKGLYHLRYIGDAFGEAIFGLFTYTIGGILAAVLWDWIVMIWLEALILVVDMANNIRTIARK